MVRATGAMMLACLATRMLAGQSSHSLNREDRAGTRAVEIWAGVSRGSAMLGQLGDMPNETMTLTGVRFVRRVRGAAGRSVEYGFDLIPVALLSPPYRMPDASCSVTCPSVGDPSAGALAHGAGMNPVSLTALFRTDRALQFRVGGTAGALWFDRPVPVSTAARFNFTGSLELGTQVVGRGGNGLLLLYRFHHLSNAGRGTDNPGIASQVLSLGARWRLGGPLR